MALGKLMMDEILDVDLAWLILGLSLIPAFSTILLYTVTQHGPFATALQAFRGVVAPFFASVGILFAVFAAFLGADIWERVQASNHSLEKEVAGVASIMQIAKSLGESGAAIATGAKRYMQSTLDEESTTRGQSRSAPADAALLVFTLACTATLVALAMNERPLADPALVSLDHLYRIAGDALDN